MSKKIIYIMLVQMLLIIGLFWVLIFYAKDEYETYQSSQEEEIEAVNRVTESAGVNVVSLPLATQQNSGIQIAKVLAASSNAAALKSYGNVVALDSLFEAKAKLISLKSELSLARSASGYNIQQYQRLKSLNADDKNVSDQVVQEALAAINADKAKASAGELQLTNLQNSVKLQWGENLAKLLSDANLPPHLAHLLNRQNVLLQLSLPLDAPKPRANSSITVTPLNDANTRITAVYVSPATQSDLTGIGKTFYYSAPADLLRIGARVNVLLAQSQDSTQGVVIPSNAVVWYGGKSWAYFKQGTEQFVRKPIAADTELAGGWFNQNFSANDEVVVSGAQLLLSEEFKYLIKNENED
jgi:hypothetical protein